MKEKETNIKYQPEFAHPHEVLKNKVSLTIASPKGGEAPLDPASVKMFESDAVSQTFLKEQRALWENTHKLEDILPRVGEFDAIFYVGGHGRMFPPRQYTMIYLLSKSPKTKRICVLTSILTYSNVRPNNLQNQPISNHSLRRL
jgi:hypothetical protein